jgi:hypothetical protein
MENLEGILKRIEGLKKDLFAEVVIQEAIEGHYEDDAEEAGLGSGAASDAHYYSHSKGWLHWVEGKPRIAEPNTKKRETARKELQNIYESSEWYSVKYAAGKALDINVDERLELWIENLRKQLHAEEVVVEGESNVYHKGSSSGGDAREAVWDEPDIIGPDLKTREKAVEDIAGLLEVSGLKVFRALLKEAYNIPDNNSTIRIKAGNALGYSNLRIWVHENPIKSIGIITTGSILGYILYHYLAK